MTTIQNAISVDALKKTFNHDVLALDGVSFVVEEGSIFGLLGPNGAGKTTIVRILTTTLHPDSGVASVFGHDVAREPQVVRTLFGLAGQFAAVDENLTGRENLIMVGRLSHLTRSVARDRAMELLAQFQLLDAKERTLKTYSGGMRRRLDVAAALVANPKVLFLDEPTTGLDPHSRNDLWEVIEDLVKGGTTVLLTTQYLEEADRLAKRVAVVDQGRVITQGTPAELKANLGATILEVGLSDESTAAATASALATVGPHAPHVTGSSVEITVDNGPQVAMEVLRLLDQHHIEPTTFALREPSLDDVFLALTGHQAENSQTANGGMTQPTNDNSARSRR